MALRSPRRVLTLEEKKERDAKYRVSLKEFGDELKEIVQIFNSLSLLNNLLGQAGKGAYLEFTAPTGAKIPFNRKQLRTANAHFAKRVMALKNYLRVARKKTRETVAPDTLSGTYTPVYAAPALLSFFTQGAANFGLLNPSLAAAQDNPTLMSQLTEVQQGYLLRNTTTMLFYIYAHAQGLQLENAQLATSDPVMDAAFGGAIAAAFVSTKAADGKIMKESMFAFQARGEQPMNTYDVIRRVHPTFNSQQFNTYFYQNIAAANYYSKNTLAAVPELEDVSNRINTPDVRQAMLNEHNLVKRVSAAWHDILEPGRKAKREQKKREKKAGQ